MIINYFDKKIILRQNIMKNIFSTLFIFFVFCQSNFAQSKILTDENLEQLDIHQAVSYWIDKDYHFKSATAIPHDNFEPFPHLDTLRKYSTKVIWLKFQIKNIGNKPNHLILNLGKHFFLDLFVIKKNRILHTKAGALNSWQGLIDGYALPILLNPDETADVYVRMGTDIFYSRNIYSSPTLFSPQAYKKQTESIFRAKKSHALLMIGTIGFLICGIIVAFSQYFTTKRLPVFYYLFTTVMSALNIIRLTEYHLDFRFISEYIPFYFGLTFILQILQCLSFYILITQIFSIKKNKFTQYGIPLLVILFVLESVVVYQILEFRALNTIIFYWYALSLVLSDGMVLVIIFYAQKQINNYNVYIVYGFFAAFLLFSVTFYLGIFKPQLTLTPNEFLFIPSIYICFGTIVEFIFFMIALSKKIQLVEKESLIKGQTSERNRIARELHDNVNSLLASVKLTLQVIRPTPEQKSIYLNLLRMLDNATQEVRTISHSIIPLDLEKEGLFNSLRTLVVRQNMSNNKKYIFESNGIYTRLKPEIEYNLYMICFEFCQNINKNDSIHEIKIEFIIEPNQQSKISIHEKSLYLFIWTDGIFEDKFNLQQSIHRSKSIGAEFEIIHALNETIYSIQLPYNYSIIVD